MAHRRHPLILTALLATVLSLLGGACSNTSAGGDRNLIPTLGPATPRSALTAGAEPRVEDGIVIAGVIPVLNVDVRQWRTTNFRRYVQGLDPQEFVSIGVAKNGIPPIHQPQFVTVSEAKRWQWMTPGQPMAVLLLDGEDVRAYPLAILTAHEVVNDTVGGEPVIVTYSPTSAAVRAFKRTVDGETLTFGTTGNARHGNMVMWDDRTESWWQQASGQALIGDMAGRRLTAIPVVVTSLAELERAFPDARVLSQSSAPSYFLQIYGSTPYLSADAPNNPPTGYFGVLDSRVDPVERVLGLEVDGAAVAFPFSVLAGQGAANAAVAGQPAVVFWRPGTRSALDREVIAESRDVGSAAAFDPRVDGQVLTFVPDGVGFRDQQTGTLWSLLGTGLEGPLAGARLQALDARLQMWFLWRELHPETDIHRPAD